DGAALAARVSRRHRSPPSARRLSLRYARLCRHGDAGDVGPRGEGLGAAGPEVGGGVVVSAAGEKVGELVMGGKEALNVPRRLEPLHDPLSSSGRLMGVFSPVIEALVLSMLDPRHDLSLGRGVALELVGDEHTRGSTLLLEELAEQAFGGLLVAPALDENIKNEAVLVDGTKLTPTSSRCHLSPRRGARRRMRLANSRPNLRPH